MPIVTETISIPIKALDEATATINNIEKSLDAISRKTKERHAQMQTDAKEEAKAAQEQQQNLKATAVNAAMLTTAFYAVGKAATAAYSFAKEGAQLEYTAVRFDRLAASVGTTGDEFRQNLMTATKGTLSEMDAMSLGANVLQLGLAKDAEQATRLASVMTGLGMDVGEVTLALANQSTRRLDQLGVSLSKFKEVQESLKGKGLSKEDLFTEAFLQTAEQTIALTGNMADESVGQFMRMEAAWTDMANSMKTSAAVSLMPTVKDVGMFFRGIQQLTSGATAMDWGAVFGGGDQWVSNVFMGVEEKLLQAKYNLDQFQRETITGRGGVQVQTNLQTDEEQLARAQLKGALATEFYSQQVTKLVEEKQQDVKITEGQLKLGFQITGQNKQYADSIKKINDAFALDTRLTNNYTLQVNELQKAREKGTISEKQYVQEYEKLKDNLRDGKNNLDDVVVSYKNSEFVAGLFNERVKELNISLKEGALTQEEYAKKMSDLNTAYSSGKFAEDEKKKAIADLEQAQLDSTEATVSALLEQAGADNKTQLDYAFATGQITKDAHERAIAIDSISKAIASGAMTANEGAIAVQLLVGKLKMLDGMTVTAFVNLLVNDETGSIDPFMQDLNKKQKEQGLAVSEASGGQLTGNWTLVGDAPGGRLTPYSELISPSGYVYNAQQTRAIMQSGRISPVSRAFGDIDPFTNAPPSPIQQSPLPPLPDGITGKIDPGTGDEVSMPSTGTIQTMADIIMPDVQMAATAAIIQTMPSLQQSMIAALIAVTQGNQTRQAQIQNELLTDLNDNVLRLISKTASAGDIGRSVQYAVQTGT